MKDGQGIVDLISSKRHHRARGHSWCQIDLMTQIRSFFYQDQNSRTWPLFDLHLQGLVKFYFPRSKSNFPTIFICFHEQKKKQISFKSQIFPSKYSTKIFQQEASVIFFSTHTLITFTMSTGSDLELRFWSSYILSAWLVSEWSYFTWWAVSLYVDLMTLIWFLLIYILHFFQESNEVFNQKA